MLEKLQMYNQYLVMKMQPNAKKISNIPSFWFFKIAKRFARNLFAPLALHKHLATFPFICPLETWSITRAPEGEGVYIFTRLEHLLRSSVGVPTRVQLKTLSRKENWKHFTVLPLEKPNQEWNNLIPTTNRLGLVINYCLQIKVVEYWLCVFVDSFVG